MLRRLVLRVIFIRQWWWWWCHCCCWEGPLVHFLHRMRSLPRQQQMLPLQKNHRQLSIDSHCGESLPYWWFVLHLWFDAAVHDVMMVVSDRGVKWRLPLLDRSYLRAVAAVAAAAAAAAVSWLDIL